ncbi:MAG: hypothetical protein A2539_07325 [Elusimicrobia bacterium RIFOXYD2_FULL_34_15]|nr:MAG: hypothetical protein A2539_07325 [Elusimicrobia bacterium RIFOXYD2_FULL_34_15]
MISIILICFLFAFFWKAATLRGLFITPDIDTQDTICINYAYKNFLSESLRFNKSFLWTPYIFNGYPIHSEGQGGFCYPLNLLFFRFLPTFIAFNYSIIFTFFIAGFFTFLYARILNLSKTTSLFSAITFMFSGFFILHVKHLNMIQAACWIPLLFLLIELFLRTNNMMYSILIGVIFAFQILTGFPQIAYYSFLSILLYIFSGIFRKKKIITLILAFFIISLVGAGLSAIQWLPTYELVKLGIRESGVSNDFLTTWSYRFKDLITFFKPFYYGNIVDATYPFYNKNIIFWENSFYFGLLPFIFILIALIFEFKKNQQLKIFLIFILIFFTIALHNELFLTNILKNILPGFKYFRIHQRILFIAIFLISIFSGFGFEFVKNKIPQKFQKAFIIFIPLAFLDLFRFGINQNPTYDPKKWLSFPESAKILQMDRSIYRIDTFSDYIQDLLYRQNKGWSNNTDSYYYFQNFLTPNSNMLYHISMVSGHIALQTNRVSKFEDIYRHKIAVIAPKNDFSFIEFSTREAILFGIQNGKYIISAYPIKSESLKLRIDKILKDFSYSIYENTKFVPRVVIVPKAEIFKDETKILDYIQSGKFNPFKTVILEEETNFGSDTINIREVKIKKYENSEVVINTKSSSDGYLVLNDTYYPGWKCFVDEKEEKIFKANYLFRAVFLSKGQHVVKFMFKPKSFEYGKIATFITTIIILTFGLTIVKKKNILRRK